LLTSPLGIFTKPNDLLLDIYIDNTSTAYNTREHHRFTLENIETVRFPFNDTVLIQGKITDNLSFCYLDLF
jgi:hypothetical protein